jgi:outer membrane protein TolC
LLLASGLFSTGAFAQNRVLTFEDFNAIVKQHHPVAQQAELQLKRGEASVQMARGAFDPKVGTDVGQKYYKGDQYYSLIDAGLKVPTWFGIELNAGYEQNGGLFLNPENSTSGGGLVYAGITLPVGRGLFIDERRAELRKAQIFQKSTVVEQRLMMNELLYDAGKAYWNWFEAFQVLTVYQEVVNLAQLRLEAVRQEAYAGDRSAIDTVEAGIQWQNRQLGLKQAQLNFKNATARLSIFLWQQGQVPLEIVEGTVPVGREEVSAVTTDAEQVLQIDSVISDHPYLRQFRYRIDQMRIERKVKLEQFKPQVDLKYNALSQVVGSSPFSDLSPNNLTWGLQFSMPIPLRKERGALRLTDIKLQETDLKVVDQQAVINAKAQIAINELETTFDQAVLYRQTVADYSRLLDGERQKFEAGESSLFLLNAREVGFIETRIKYVELLAKNQQAELNVRYSLGIVADD